MITKEISEEEAYNKLAALCSKSEHCSGELRLKMRRWQMDDDTCARVMRRLEEERFVDDTRYARFFSRDKSRFERWGRRKIEQSLMMKGIDREVASEALGEIDDEVYVSSLQSLLKAKRKSLSGASQYERDTKLIRYALGRGFDMHIIRRCMANDGYACHDCDPYADDYTP